MIFRCQNLRWRTNTRLRILHPHDQFKSLLECGVWSCVLFWQILKRSHLEISRKCTYNYLHLKSLLLGGNFQLKFMFYKKNTKIWRNLLLTLKFHYYISSNKKWYVFKFLPSQKTWSVPQQYLFARFKLQNSGNFYR